MTQLRTCTGINECVLLYLPCDGQVSEEAEVHVSPVAMLNDNDDLVCSMKKKYKTFCLSSVQAHASTICYVILETNLFLRMFHIQGKCIQCKAPAFLQSTHTVSVLCSISGA